jgi:PAS domain S-box-containing protein/putative nucleotidyltransferase with HDIG domain
VPSNSLTPNDLESLLTFVPHAACVLDGRGVVVRTNAIWSSIVPNPCVPGETTFLQAVADDGSTPLADALKRALAGEEVGPVTVEPGPDAADARWVEWRFASTGDGGFTALGRDVTRERRRGDTIQELRLLEGEAEHVAKLGSWRLDLSDGGLVWSPEMYRIFGVDPSEDLDLAAVTERYIHPDDRAFVRELNKSVFETGMPRPARYRVMRSDDTVRWVQAQGRQVLDAAGHAIALVGFVQDITERVLFEEAIRASEARYRSIIDGMQDAYFRADLKGRLTLANQAAARMYGFASPADMVGVPAESLYANASDREDVFEQLKRDGSVVDRIGQGRKRDGTTFYVSLNVDLAWDANGAAVGTEGFARDVSARVAAEEALRKSEGFLQRVLDTSPNLIYIYDLVETRNRYTNREITEFLGYTSEQILALGSELFAHILHPDDAALVGEHHAHMRALPPGDDSVIEVDYRMRRADGEWRWLHSRDVPFARDESGAVTQILGSTEDVTPRVDAERLLRESETKFRTIAEFTYDWETWTAPDGRVLYVSPSCERTTGYTVEEFVGDRELFARIVHPADRDLISGHFGLDGTPADCPVTFRIVRRDGGVRWIEHVCEAVFDEQGTDLGRRASNRDITDRVEAERALRESAEDLRDAQAIARIGSYVYDLTTNEWSASETMRDIFGIDESYRRDLDGWTMLVHVDDRDMMSRYFADDVVGLHHPFDKVYRVTRASDGQTVWVHGHGKLEYDDEGGVRRMIGAIQDITLRHRDEEALHRTNESLERMVYEVAEAMGRMIEIRDQYTKGHQERTARVAKAIAVEMGLRPHDVTAVEMAAVVHDIGKLSVPAEILTRPTILSELEMGLIREHPHNGYEILKDIPFPWPVAEIVLQHHERMDGSGYPAGLSGAAIVPLARILTVADVVEAMATHRPYRPALGLPAAFNELSEHAALYDPEVVAACVRVFERGGLDL